MSLRIDAVEIDDGNAHHPRELPLPARCRAPDQRLEIAMSRGLDQMTDAELAEWQYAHRDELEAEDGEPVHAEISPQLSVTLSFRVPGSEADAIREAAREAGMSMSEWIRQACALAAAPDAAATQAREVREALDEAGKSIQEAKRRMGSEPVRAAPKKTVKKATAEKSTKKAGTKSTGKTAAKKPGKKSAKKSTRRAR